MKLNFCALCGSTDNIEHHHVLPKSLGGSNDADNLLTLCSTHHVQLHNLSPGRINHRGLIRAAKATQKQQGLFLGGLLPYGYTNKFGKLVENTEEQRIIAEMKDLHYKGMSLRKIQSWLYDNHNIKRSHTTIAVFVKYKNSELVNQHQNSMHKKTEKRISGSSSSGSPIEPD